MKDLILEMTRLVAELMAENENLKEFIRANIEKKSLKKPNI